VSFALTQKQKINNTSYPRYYSPTLLGGLQATEEGTYDAGESELTHTRGPEDIRLILR
jgi:hypothetical protein